MMFGADLKLFGMWSCHRGTTLPAAMGVTREENWVIHLHSCIYQIGSQPHPRSICAFCLCRYIGFNLRTIETCFSPV